jgi:hypothetical protein
LASHDLGHKLPRNDRLPYRKTVLTYFKINLLKKEVISDQLVSLLFGKFAKRIESPGEVTSIRLKRFANLLHYAISLLVRDAGTERELSEITADTNSCGHDHSLFIEWQRRAVKLAGIHA